METAPVVIFYYARPHLLEGLLAAVLDARPARLYAVTNSPAPEDEARWRECRALFAPHDVEHVIPHVRFSVREVFHWGMNYVLAREPFAICLEEDALPHPAFFTFATQVGAYYADDNRVGALVGVRHLEGAVGAYSHAFGRYPTAHGWATWRRAWEGCDTARSRWREERAELRTRLQFETPRAKQFWLDSWDALAEGRDNVRWDLEWSLHCRLKDQLVVIPRTNLVSDRGYGPDALHALDASSPRANRPTASPGLFAPPPILSADEKYDRQAMTLLLGT